MTPTAALLGTDEPLCRLHDVALLDLDGVIYVGAAAVPHAVQSVLAAVEQGMRWAPVTNNAARPASVVAEHLTSLGLATEPGDVVTSAHAAARVLSERLPASASVLVCGAAGLVEALTLRGLTPVAATEGAADRVDAVVTGHDPATDYPRLAETTLALRRGLPWVASNTDANVPTPRGLQPGAGAVVAFLSTASGRRPDEVAGKPHPALHRECVIRTGATSPLVVGDRLDTDIAGAVAVGVRSLLVLTGVVGPNELLQAEAGARPDHVAVDLRGLLEAQPGGSPAGEGWTVGGATASVVDGRLEIRGGDGIDGLRAACAVAWTVLDSGEQLDLGPAVDQLRAAIAGG